MLLHVPSPTITQAPKYINKFKYNSSSYQNNKVKSENNPVNSFNPSHSDTKKLNALRREKTALEHDN